MSANLSAGARQACLTAYLNQTSTSAGVSVNGQTAGGGLLVIGTSSLSGATGVLVTLTLAGTPPFTLSNVGATSVATLVLGGGISATPSANGTAALAELRDSASNTIVSGLTVTTSGGGGDIIVSTTTISTAVTVSVTSGTITNQ